MNVFQALCNPAFAGSRILAGWHGLDRETSCVTVAEVPDAASWLSGGELVLTTGYFSRQAPHMFEDWLTGLHQSGAAAVAIKPQRFFGLVPPAIIDLADRLNLPLIALPYNVSWPQIIRPLMEQMIFQGTRSHPDYTERLVDLLKYRSGFSTVSQTLSNLIGLPVVTEDPGGAVLGLGLNYGGMYSARILQERLSAARPHLKRHAVDWLEEGVAKPWVQRPVELAGQKVIERIHPLVCGPDLRGFLSVLVLQEPPTDFDEILRLWATGISLAFDRFAAYRDRPVSESRRVLREALCNSGPAADEEVQKLVSSLGAVAVLSLPSGATQPAVRVVAREREDGGQELEATDQLVLDVETWIKSFDPVGAVLSVDDGLAVLFHPPTDKRFAEFAEVRMAELAQVAERAGGASPVQIGVGEPARGIEQYRRSLQQAMQAAIVARTQKGAPRVCLYRSLGVYRMLFSAPQPDELRALAQKLLAPLVRVDRERGADLVSTLEEFFAANGDLALAAQRLFLHPNTMRYRLRQVESLTGLDLKNLEDQAQIYLALKIGRLHGDI